MTSGVHQIIDRQIRYWELEARARRQADQESPGAPPRIRPWVTISRQLGAGGGEVGRLLAERLNFELLDREIVEVLVREERAQRSLIESLDERDRSALEVWVESLLHGRALYKGDYLRALVRVISGIALHGRVVLMGRGANFILRPADGLHARIAAPFARRVAAVAERLSLSRMDAERRVAEADAERAAFVQEHFHRSIDDPIGYDLIVNRSSLEPAPVAELLEQALRRKLEGRDDVDF